MPCALTLSKPLDCNDGVGGIVEVKFKVLPSSTTLASDYTLTSGVITIASGSQTGWFLYNLELETAVFNTTPTVNRQNGTLHHVETLTMIVNKMSAAMQNEIKLLAQNRLQVAVKTHDGTYWLLGYQNGLMVTTIAGTTGTAMGDRNGYTFNFEGKEKEPTVNMTSATYADL